MPSGCVTSTVGHLGCLLLLSFVPFFLEIPKTFGGGDSTLPLGNEPLKMSVLHESYVSSPGYRP